MTISVGNLLYIPFDVPATELAAGTTIEVVSPEAGVIKRMVTIVQTAIVTGGDMTVKIGTTDVVGLSITHANSATKGTVQSDEPTVPSVTRYVAQDGRIQIVPSAAYNGGGAISGYLVIEMGKNDN